MATKVRQISIFCRTRLTVDGFLGHLVLECGAHSSHIPRYARRVTSYPLPAQRYAHDPGCLSLYEAVNFICLLSAIRRHLYTSTDTQWYYVSFAREFQCKILGGSCAGPQPCTADFLSFVVDYWPTFRSIEGSVERILWGSQSKPIHRMKLVY